jgi:methionyl aminopeptidase
MSPDLNGMAVPSIKSEAEIDLMRESSAIVAQVLKLIGASIQAGVTTGMLDRIAEDFIRSCDAVPVFKGYGFEPDNLFPATLCISIDNEVVHGIPGMRILKDGEIVSIDVGVKKNGFVGDGAYTFPVGRVSQEKERLMRITQESLAKGVEAAIDGNKVGDIGYAVQAHVEEAGYSVVRELCGHGVGASLHEAPNVPNYGRRNTGMKLVEGLTIAIEPMVNQGTHKVRTAHDGWTVLTYDGAPSAHFEHTVVVRKGKAEILTK